MVYDLNFLLTVIGLLLGIYPLYITIKQKRYPGRLVLVKENAVGLFSELANFQDIQIQHKSRPIDRNIIYLKASLVNDGKLDLDLNSGEVPFVIALNERFKWVQCSITAASKGVNCSVRVSNNKAIFSCKTLQIHEFFQLEALIQANRLNTDSQSVFDGIQVVHRLMHTQKKVRVIALSDLENSWLRITYLSIVAGIALFLLTLISSTSVFSDFAYRYNGQVYSDATLKDNNMVSVKNENKNVRQPIPLRKFANEFKLYKRKRDVWAYKLSIIIEPSIFAFVFICICEIAFYLRTKKSNLLKRIISGYKHPYLTVGSILKS